MPAKGSFVIPENPQTRTSSTDTATTLPEVVCADQIYRNRQEALLRAITIFRNRRPRYWVMFSISKYFAHQPSFVHFFLRMGFYSNGRWEDSVVVLVIAPGTT
jgi:hypothetical protein